MGETSDAIYRPGLEGVIAGETAISTIADGLRYHGFSIEDLASHATFEETAFLLLDGQLPNANGLAAFRGELAQAAADFPAGVITAIRALPPETPPMDALRTGASLLAHWDPRAADNTAAANRSKAIRLLAQLPIVMAAQWRIAHAKEPIAPQPDQSLAHNILWMLHGDEPSAERARALDVTLILYAEHEFNASTFTARVVSSTLSDLHSAITAAIGALKGPLHGGANERVMEVLERVGSPDRAETWVRDALARKERIMGFGHRVYKEGDPRAAFLKPLCQRLAEETGNQALEQTAETIERIVGSEKKLPPNLDWPSARLYHYMGLAVPLYTPLFVLSRVVGWSAHVIEQHANNRLIRPRARYTGCPPRNWVPLAERA